MQVSIQGDKFLFDGELTYSDFPGAKPEALGRLMNTRMVQATFEDENPKTRDFFTYPDGSPFDEDSVRIENCRAAWEAGSSWGYYDQGGQTKYHDGFQSPPTNWSINTPEKKAFFETVAELAGIQV